MTVSRENNDEQIDLDLPIFKSPIYDPEGVRIILVTCNWNSINKSMIRRDNGVILLRKCSAKNMRTGASVDCDYFVRIITIPSERNVRLFFCNCN